MRYTSCDTSGTHATRSQLSLAAFIGSSSGITTCQPHAREFLICHRAVHSASTRLLCRVLSRFRECRRGTFASFVTHQPFVRLSSHSPLTCSAVEPSCSKDTMEHCVTKLVIIFRLLRRDKASCQAALLRPFFCKLYRIWLVLCHEELIRGRLCRAGISRVVTFQQASRARAFVSSMIRAGET